jgi:hypothetical protein
MLASCPTKAFRGRLLHVLQAVARNLSFTENLARKLCLEATLHGHTGCVSMMTAALGV